MSANAVFAQGLGGAEEQDLENGGYTFAFPEGVKSNASAALKNCIERLHCNTGHASREDLARVVRLAGGSEDAVLCCKALRCSA